MANNTKFSTAVEKSGEQLGTTEKDLRVLSVAAEEAISMKKLQEENLKIREKQKEIKGSISTLVENLNEKSLDFIEGFIGFKQINSDVNDMLEALALYEVKHRKLYKDAGFQNFSDYCKSRGISKSLGYDWVQHVETVNPENFPQLVEKVGLNRTFFRAFSLVPKQIQEAIIKEGELEINGRTVDFSESGEAVKQLVLGLADELNNVKNEKDAVLRTKDKLLKAKDDLIHKQEKDLSKLEKQAPPLADFTEEEAEAIELLRHIQSEFIGFITTIKQKIKPCESTPEVALRQLYFLYIFMAKVVTDERMKLYEYYKDAEFVPWEIDDMEIPSTAAMVANMPLTFELAEAYQKKIQEKIAQKNNKQQG